MRTIMILGIGIILIIIVALGAFSFISYDMDNRATDSATLNPKEAVLGNALVVYEPSITGNTKNVASLIAGDLQAAGYKVDLAGIKNPKAENTSKYNVIVVGGPIYGGNTSQTVKKYLQTLKTAENTKIGVFATGDPHTTDEAMIRKQIAPIPENKTFQINALMVFSTNDDKAKKSLFFVDNLLK